MLCSLVALSLLADGARIAIPTSDGRERLYYADVALPAPKKCPKYRWEFPFCIEALARPTPVAEPQTRFRVFSQSPKAGLLARSVARCLLRLWDLSNRNLSIDNPMLFGSIVEVYLCDGGSAGGEQGIFSRPGDRPANCIYIYRLDTFTEPVEMAREVAHEYGHAVLPAVGGFVAPEDWGNGYLGEKLFLTWMSQEALEGKITPDDVMGASAEALRDWVARFAFPLADHIWRFTAREAVLAGKGQSALDEYIGLVLYLKEAFPQCLARAMKLAGGSDAVSVLRGAIDAVNERDSWEVSLPARLKTDVWLPLRGKLRIKAGTVLNRRGDWVLIRPAVPTLKISRS
jgi:hypothetical protein